MRQVVIWDGKNFLRKSESEAQTLVVADKAQILPAVIDGLSLKRRKDFTGYGAAPAPAAENTPTQVAPTAPAPDPEPDTASIAEEDQGSDTDVDWRQFRKDAADALDKPYNKTTKADVEDYLATKGQ